MSGDYPWPNHYVNPCPVHSGSPWFGIYPPKCRCNLELLNQLAQLSRIAELERRLAELERLVGKDSFTITYTTTTEM